MTQKCLDIGTIQAFLDGEIDFAQADAVSAHVAQCDNCANLLAESEEESAFAFAALEQEFDTLVPTKRLWTKINDSIEQEREKKSFWKPIFAFLLQPSTAAFTSLILVFAVVISLLTTRPNQTAISYVAPSNSPSASRTEIARTTENNQAATENQTPPIAAPSAETENNAPRLIAAKTEKNERSEFRPARAVYVEENNPKVANDARVGNSPRNPEIVNSNRNENLSGEESYVKTIAALTETVNTRKDEVLNSSARFAFERDMQMTDDAIENMRKEVKKNPKNEAAKQILRASYQNKIDLLNSVAEKNELMASVR